MKKFFLFFAMSLFLMMANSQTKQTRGEEEVSFGIKAGVNFASFAGDGTDDLSGRTGLHVGAMAEIPLGSFFAVQPELIYSMQGAEYDVDGQNGKFKFDYLNIPVIFKFEVAEGLNLEVGPQVGFLLSANAEMGDIEQDIKDYIKGTDFAAAVGLSYRMQSGLSVGARANLGFSEGSDDEDFFDPNWKNSVIQISLGYFF